ncbi:MAG TPA: signal peptidase I [Candidatus Andersenbacteria bacterium]|nr:signal peptidase I [Candidatus Andersenbacteria bacterium]
MKMLAAVGAFFWELIKVFLLAMAIIVPIRYFLVQPFFVRGASMEPNFLDGEYLVVDELSYRLREPRRGEVIVFQFPNNPSQFFIKRIVGLPRERVEIQGGVVTIYNDKYPSGVVLDEAQYLTGEVRTGGSISTTLSADEFFVLGDNRSASSDSRSWGSLGEDAIIGRAWIRAFPIDRVGVLEFDHPGFIGKNQ